MEGLHAPKKSRLANYFVILPPKLSSGHMNLIIDIENTIAKLVVFEDYSNTFVNI